MRKQAIENKGSSPSAVSERNRAVRRTSGDADFNLCYQQLVTNRGISTIFWIVNGLRGTNLRGEADHALRGPRRAPVLRVVGWELRCYGRRRISTGEGCRAVWSGATTLGWTPVLAE